MVTTKQLGNLISVAEALKQKEMSIVELQKELNMKRSTLIYYLGILEEKGWLTKEVQEKKQGKPTTLKFDKKNYEQAGKDFEKRQKEEEEKLLKHPLTFEVLELLKKDSTLTHKELHGKTTDYFRKANHLNWLISKGLIIQEFRITPEGEKFLKEHSKKE
ncbi:MAG: winged helix-turn-helix domain-containing protein [Nanoarchaeota archaeon]|nr:winged helix-turn-helix domain-containing protein [Nanoarchaeota archaeon]